MLLYGIGAASFGQLGNLGAKILACTNRNAVVKVKFVRPYWVAYIDQTMLTAKNNGGPGTLSSTYPEVNQYLKQCRLSHLAENASCGTAFPQTEIITTRRFVSSSGSIDTEVVEWARADVLHFMPSLSDRLGKRIVENLWEIVHNSLIHGEGANGVSVSGQFYPTMGYFEVAFYDSGFGIPGRVKDFRAIKMTARDHECIEWALQKGNSTRPLGETGGLGLHLLRDFLRVNHGSIQIVSGNGYFGQDEYGQSSFLTLRNPIAGTLVNMRVVFDDNLYQLEGEAQ